MPLLGLLLLSDHQGCCIDQKVALPEPDASPRPPPPLRLIHTRDTLNGTPALLLKDYFRTYTRDTLNDTPALSNFGTIEPRFT